MGSNKKKQKNINLRKKTIRNYLKKQNGGKSTKTLINHTPLKLKNNSRLINSILGLEKGYYTGASWWPGKSKILGKKRGGWGLRNYYKNNIIEPLKQLVLIFQKSDIIKFSNPKMSNCNYIHKGSSASLSKKKTNRNFRLFKKIL